MIHTYASGEQAQVGDRIKKVKFPTETCPLGTEFTVDLIGEYVIHVRIPDGGWWSIDPRWWILLTRADPAPSS